MTIISKYELKVSPERSFLFSFFTFIPVLLLGPITLVFIAVPFVVPFFGEFDWMLILPFCMGLFGMIGFLSLLKVLIWINFGKEIIKIENDYIRVIRRGAIGVKNEKVLLSDIKNIRIVDYPYFEYSEILSYNNLSRAVYAPDLGGRVAFDTGTKTVYLGNFLDYSVAKELQHEIEQRAINSSKLVDIENVEFKRIKTVIKNQSISLSYSPKRDVLSLIAIIASFIIFSSFAILTINENFNSVDSLFSFSKDTIFKIYLLPVFSLFLLSVVLYMTMSSEKFILKNNKLIIRKPFSFYIRKIIAIDSIQKINLQDEIILKGYWSVGKGRKNKTYTAHLGNRIILQTDNKTYYLGRGLSYPEGQYIKSLIEKRLPLDNKA